MYENTVLHEMPIAFQGHPFVYLATIFSLLILNLLALEWLWRLLWSFREDRLPFRHPVTTFRLVLVFLVSGAIIRSGPDLVLLMAWPEISPDARRFIADTDNLMDSVAFLPFGLAWVFAHIGGPMILYQLQNKPIPLHLWPTLRQMQRPLKIGLGAAALAALLTFAR